MGLPAKGRWQLTGGPIEISEQLAESLIAVLFSLQCTWIRSPFRPAEIPVAVTQRDRMADEPSDSVDGHDSFSALVAAARLGDQPALNELMHRSRNYLLLVANQDLGSDLHAKMGASDIVQQTMISACQKFQQFRGSSEDELIAWLRRILKNDILDARRHFLQTRQRDAGREHRLDDSQILQPPISDPHHTPGTNALVSEQEQLLENAMSQLPDNYQCVIRMRNWEEMPFEAIGEHIGTTAEAARKIWTRAIAKLAGFLEAAEASDRQSSSF